MVPVLSSRSTSTSPAASTARPLMASTFAWFRRLMPAMPMAESSAPMVVGARHTNSATSEVMVVGFAMPAWSALKPLNANSDTDTMQEHDGQRHEQNLERDLVRGLLAGGRLHHGDHLVEEAMARVGGHAHHQPVGKHGGASGDGGAVAARLADDRGRLAGDGALVHRCGAHDDLAIGGDLLACRHVEQVLLLQNRRTHLVGLQAEELSRIVHVMALRHQALVELVRDHIALGGAQRVGLRLAAALGERLREVREQHRAARAPPQMASDEARAASP